MSATAETTLIPNRATAYPWLFSARVDLAVFLGSALVSLLLLAAGWRLGLLEQATPGWAWVSTILLIDVAHVYATGFRVYFDRTELARRPLLYFGVPVLGFLAGAAVYSLGSAVFWRALAYLAVFHFVRQQYGWVALYRAKANEQIPWERRLDTAAIYLATIYPLVYWHAHLPRAYEWFLTEDFLPGLPAAVATVLAPIYWTVMTAYFLKSFWCYREGRANPGKDIVVLTTAVCWYMGIVSFNSDYAFSVTNVIIHGIPYMALVYWYWARRQPERTQTKPSRWKMLVIFLSTIWFLAYVEELLWDQTTWHERAWLFGSPVTAEGWEAVLVPLLAVPQLTHYVLDGFIWKRRRNPQFAQITQSSQNDERMEDGR